jgi:hypothetical protein
MHRTADGKAYLKIFRGQPVSCTDTSIYGSSVSASASEECSGIIVGKLCISYPLWYIMFCTFRVVVNVCQLPFSKQYALGVQATHTL